MTNELILDMLEVLSRHGVISQVTYRNEKMRMEYRCLRSQGVKGREAREQLSDRYNIDGKTVEGILYPPKKEEGK